MFNGLECQAKRPGMCPGENAYHISDPPRQELQGPPRWVAVEGPETPSRNHHAHENFSVLLLLPRLHRLRRGRGRKRDHRRLLADAMRCLVLPYGLSFHPGDLLRLCLEHLGTLDLCCLRTEWNLPLQPLFM